MTARWLVVWFALVVAGSIASRLALSGARADRCRLDGVRITPIYRVDLAQDGVVLASFCCVRCASEWPDVPAEAYWQVRDEVTGAVLDATRACFVESAVVTVPSRQDRTHSFASWADAMGHADEYDGRRIPNPLVVDDRDPETADSTFPPATSRSTTEPEED